MHSNLFRRASLGLLFLVCLAGAGSSARVAAQDVGTAPADTRDDRDDKGFDEGLLGLAGLAGLLGLRRRNEHTTKRGDVNRDVNRSTTSRV